MEITRPASPAPVRRQRRTLIRALAVIGAVAAAVVVWLVAVPFIGVSLEMRSGSSTTTILFPIVIVASLVGSAAGWALLEGLERVTSRGGAIWTTVAIVVLALSLSMPLTLGANLASKLTLACMHLAVAAVLIPTLSLTARRRS